MKALFNYLKGISPLNVFSLEGGLRRVFMIVNTLFEFFFTLNQGITIYLIILRRFLCRTHDNY